MMWILSRSTSSWILVRVWAGVPPPSATKSSTLRPAIVLFFSCRYCCSARSMSMPPEASGPVLTVIRPSRIGPSWARDGSALAAATAPVAWTKRLRVNRMGLFLLQFFEKLLVGDHPAEAARDVLQAEDVQVVAVHARHAIGQDHDAIIEVEPRERRVQDAGIRVDAHQHDVLHFQNVEQRAQIRSIKAVQPLLVVDDVVAVFVELGNDLGARRALDVVLAHGALAPGRQAIGLGLRRVHCFPEGRGHAFAAHARDATVYEHDVDYRNLKAPRVIERR